MTFAPYRTPFGPVLPSQRREIQKCGTLWHILSHSFSLEKHGETSEKGWRNICFSILPTIADIKFFVLVAITNVKEQFADISSGLIL